MQAQHYEFWPRHVARELTLPKTSLWFNVEVSATRFPDRACLIFYERIVTYREFKEQAERLAGFLQRECGVRRGDRVALFMQNSPQFVIAYYAILRADAMVVPVNCMNLTNELGQILDDCGARVIIAAQELYPRIEMLLGGSIQRAIVACYSDYVAANPTMEVPDFVAAPRAKMSGPGVTLWDDAMKADLAPTPHLATDEDLCVMPYTSGTTGRPKGCVHRHRGVMHTAMVIAQWHKMYQDSTCLAVLPLFHVTGMQNSMNAQIYSGATVVLLPRWNRDVAAGLIQRHQVTGVTAVPAMIVDLLAGGDVSRYDLSSLKVIGGGGAAMPEAVAHKLQQMCGLTYIEGYGMSETMAPTHINPDDRPKAQCLGVPICNTESRVVDPTTLKEVPVGEVGEIVVHGPQILDGYWNKPTENAAAFVTLDGKRFLRTGDLGRVDQDGYFFFVDRLKRMINTAGYKVWPAEIESLLYSHPAIQEAVVIAKRDDRSGERVKALVVLKPAARETVTADQLIEWARGRMAAYKVPREIAFVDALPKSATGKLDWRTLQEHENRSAQ